jgi:hypothetical protein
LKTLKVQFEIKHDFIITEDESIKGEIIENIKAGFKEMHLIKQGKLKTTPLNEFLDEL